MKKLILIGLLCISAFADIKVDVIEEQNVKIPEISVGFSKTKKFKILCINGYQWLSSGIDDNFTLSQMFDDKNAVEHAKPIKCSKNN